MNKDELLELKETLLYREDIFESKVYTYLDEYDDSNKEELRQRLNQIETVDNKLKSVIKEINDFLKINKINGRPKKTLNETECQLKRISFPRFSGKDYFQRKSLR